MQKKNTQNSISTQYKKLKRSMAWKFWNKSCCKKQSKYLKEQYSRSKISTNTTHHEREKYMARNREFDDALDELKMLHDAKNHDYATAENPYKNLEGCERLGIEAWRGIVIRLMDKFERVEQYCVNGELAIKSEGMEDTFKDIAVYSTLAMILFRREQDKQQELTEIERGKGSGSSFFTPVDDKLQSDMDYDHPIMVNVRATEKKQKEEEARKKAMDEEIFLQDRDNRLALEDDYKIDFKKLEAERKARNN
jgi:hypothetical protein